MMTSRPEPDRETGLNPQATMAAIMQTWPETVPVFLAHRMACVGCSLAAFNTLAQAARAHNLSLEDLLPDLLAALPPGAISAKDFIQH